MCITLHRQQWTKWIKCVCAEFAFYIKSVKKHTSEWSVMFSLLFLFWKNKSRLNRSSSCLFLSVTPNNILLNVRIKLHESWYINHGTWAYLNDLLHKSLQFACVYIPLSYSYPIHTHHSYISYAIHTHDSHMFICNTYWWWIHVHMQYMLIIHTFNMQYILMIHTCSYTIHAHHSYISYAIHTDDSYMFICNTYSWFIHVHMQYMLIIHTFHMQYILMIHTCSYAIHAHHSYISYAIHTHDSYMFICNTWSSFIHFIHNTYSWFIHFTHNTNSRWMDNLVFLHTSNLKIPKS
jgi:hypothetical protein